MTAKVKLPVFEVLSDAFSFGWKKLIQLIVLYVTSTVVIFGPLFALALTLFPDLLSDLNALNSFNLESDLEGVEGGDLAPEEALANAFDQIAPYIPMIILFILGAILQGAIFSTAVIRNITQGEAVWLMKINKNVFRYILASIVVGLLIIPIYLLVGAVGLAGYTLAQQLAEFGTLIMILTVLLCICALIYLIVRISFIPVAVVSNSKFELRAGWNATKGNVLRIIGLFILAVILFMTIMIPVAIVFFAIGLDELMAGTMVSEGSIDENPLIALELLFGSFTSPSMTAINLIGTLLEVYLTAVMAALSAFAFAYMTGIKEPTEDRQEL